MGHPAGAQVIFSSDLVADAKRRCEYIYINNDVAVGTGKDFPPHKHDYEEIFLFLSTRSQGHNHAWSEKSSFGLAKAARRKNWFSPLHPPYTLLLE